MKIMLIMRIMLMEKKEIIEDHDYNNYTNHFHVDIEEKKKKEEEEEGGKERRGPIPVSVNLLRFYVLDFMQTIINKKEWNSLSEFKMLLQVIEEPMCSMEKKLNIGIMLIKSTKENVDAIKMMNRLKAVPIFLTIITLLQKTEASIQSKNSPQYLLLDKTRYVYFMLLFILLTSEPTCGELIESDIFENLFELTKYESVRVYSFQLISKVFEKPAYSTDSHKVISYYQNFSELMRSFHHKNSTKEEFEILLLIFSLCRNILKENVNSKKLFRNIDFFMLLTNFLNTEDNAERIVVLCTEVFETFISLLSGSSKSKQHLRNNIGYDQIKNLIQNCINMDTTGELEPKMLTLLFDMLVDGKFDIQSLYTIQNVDVIGLLFNLFTTFKVENKEKMIDSFIQIAERCDLNKAVCCSNQLIYHLLEMMTKFNDQVPLQVKIITLIEVLGKHSINVRELKKVFSSSKNRVWRL
eukprot:TRINITY_DN8587_c0_g1_i1.p1 TRINITY_DN8587_c0_g1~~TRINITY_DN8587_c0_g1_i1.p1  ORF type:complete len:497 (-),score=123.46 TRINITY_DN8587_c0_g1_i1:717-2117(-)